MAQSLCKKNELANGKIIQTIKSQHVWCTCFTMYDYFTKSKKLKIRPEHTYQSELNVKIMKIMNINNFFNNVFDSLTCELAIESGSGHKTTQPLGTTQSWHWLRKLQTSIQIGISSPYSVKLGQSPGVQIGWKSKREQSQKVIFLQQKQKNARSVQNDWPSTPSTSTFATKARPSPNANNTNACETRSETKKPTPRPTSQAMLLPNHPRATTIWSSTTSVYILRRPADKKPRRTAQQPTILNANCATQNQKIMTKKQIFGKNKNYDKKQISKKINKKMHAAFRMIDHRPQALQLLPPKRALHRMRTTQTLAKRGQKPKPPHRDLLRKQCCCPITRGLLQFDILLLLYTYFDARWQKTRRTGQQPTILNANCATQNQKLWPKNKFLEKQKTMTKNKFRKK